MPSFRPSNLGGFPLELVGLTFRHVVGLNYRDGRSSMLRVGHSAADRLPFPSALLLADGYSENSFFAFVENERLL